MAHREKACPLFSAKKQESEGRRTVAKSGACCYNGEKYRRRVTICE
jgi:hypothetical protein